MGNDLNFDELDKAVNTYMQKKEPATSNDATPVNAPVEVKPSPVEPAISAVPPAKSEPAMPDAVPVTPKPSVQPVSAPKPRIQVRSRQSIASRRGSSGTTFHDIVPTRRHSTVATPKQITPLNDIAAVTTPVPPAKPPLPEETSKPESSPGTIAEVKPPETPPATEEPAKLSPSDATLDDAPKILGDTANLPTVEQEEASPISEKDASTPESAEKEKSPQEMLARPEENKVSDALLEDLRKESEAAAKSPEVMESNPAPESDAAAPTAGLLSETPLELEDGKAPEEAAKPKKASHGLLDTGELHAGPKTPATSPVDVSHLLDAGDEDQPMQVFDTKEYHTPIATKSTPQPKKGKKWEIIVVVLAIMIVAAAAFVAYMMVTGSK